MSVAQFEREKPFDAVVEKVYIEDFSNMPPGLVVLIGLKTQNGERISIGGEHASDNLAGFARTLEKGETYKFPTVWSNYVSKVKQ